MTKMTTEQQKQIDNAIAQYELDLAMLRRVRNSEKTNPDTGLLYPNRDRWHRDAWEAAREKCDTTIHNIIYGNREHWCNVVGGNAVYNGTTCVEL